MEFVEFPKWLYRGDRQNPETLLVHDQKAQDKAVKKGWKTAHEFHVELPVEGRVEIPVND